MAKSKTSDTLLLVAAAVLAYYLWSRSSTISSLIFVPRGLAVQGSGVALQIGVQNPTSNAIQLESMAGSLNIQGSNVGSVTDFMPASIAPNAETPINLFVSPNVFGIAAGVINQIDGNEGSGSFSASLTGTANVNGIPVPLNIPFT